MCYNKSLGVVGAQVERMQHRDNVRTVDAIELVTHFSNVASSLTKTAGGLFVALAPEVHLTSPNSRVRTLLAARRCLGDGLPSRRDAWRRAASPGWVSPVGVEGGAAAS